MTYSHNSVSKNMKMTTAATKAAAASIRLKNGAVEAGKIRGGGAGNSPPSTPTLCAHSNSIGSNSTNDQFSHYQPMLSSSPPGSNMSSAMSTSSNSSSSSSVSSIAANSNGYFSSMRKQQRHHQQQRRSPQQQHKESGSYFNSPNQQQQQQQPGSGVKRNSGTGISTQKNRDGVQRFSQNCHQPMRQSPASILGGGLSISPTTTGSSGGNHSARKPRSKHSSPLLCVGSGMITPTHPLIPTALTHFAGSKCFDAPAPTALPKPPEHWTGTKSAEKAASSAGNGLQCILNAAAARPHHIHHQHHHHGITHDSRTHSGHIVKSSKRNLLDEFDTHNLKLLLNVQS